MKLPRREFLHLAAGAAALPAVSRIARAQTYPTRPIKMIVAFPPGGPTDTLARLTAERLSVSLGQTVIVDNRPGGGGGSVGSKAAATADPDGYTLLVASPSMAVAPGPYRNVGYDPIKSFASVVMVARSHPILVVNPAVPAKSVQELVAYAKGNPGKVHFGSPGFGTGPHLTGEMLKFRTGIDIVHVPYRGNAPAVNDLLAGQIQMYFEAGPTTLQLVETGKLRVLAVTSERRNPKMSDVPTMIESGFPGFVTSYWNGVVAPAGTPESIVNKLNAAINEGLKSPDMQASLAKIGMESTIGAPQDLAALIAAETQKWTALVKAANIKLD